MDVHASRSGRTSADDGVPGGLRVLLLEDGARGEPVMFIVSMLSAKLDSKNLAT